MIPEGKASNETVLAVVHWILNNHFLVDNSFKVVSALNWLIGELLLPVLYLCCFFCKVCLNNNSVCIHEYLKKNIQIQLSNIQIRFVQIRQLHLGLVRNQHKPGGVRMHDT